MKKIKLFTLLTMIALASSCASKTNTKEYSSSFEPRSNSEALMFEYASQRKKLVSNVSYELSVDLTKEGKTFGGKNILNFDYKNQTSLPLTIDFASGEIHSIKINGKDAAFNYSKWFISIPSEQLVDGHNEIEITYTGNYSNNGSGLYKFNDPEDGEVYLYTDFEPYDANQLFPHFDQPDLKATYTLDVKAPKHWQVIANQLEARVNIQEDTKHWFFRTTDRFSSYIFALHAGPYTYWSDNAGDIPLRLFARKSVAKYVKLDEWFPPTKKSFEFFNNYFGIKYPYHKYDQIIVPDYNSGAMENVGAVTFNEAYLSRGDKTMPSKRSQANTIAHEIAHMWFGNLVTMKWWDGLWLNESFATFMANLALDKTEMFPSIWENYYTGTKQWAYGADDSVTTHAIQQDVANTTEAFSNFDGITYGKGGSVLKQLWFYLGEQDFRNGVSQYLKSHSEKNTVLNDFISALETSSGKNLQKWTHEWLYTPGLNSIKVSYSCDNQQISAFTIHQEHSEYDTTLRTQKTRVGLFNVDGNNLNMSLATDVVYSGKTTNVTELVGKRCPDLVYPNYQDYAYVKVNLDNRSRQTLFTHIHAVADNYTRLMLWQSLMDSVRDAEYGLGEFIDFALENLPKENEYNIIRKVVNSVNGVTGYLRSAKRQGKEVKKFLDQVEAFAWNQLNDAEPGSDLQKLWYETYIANIYNDKHYDNMFKILSGELAFVGLKIDQDMRWALVYKANYKQKGNYKALLEEEKKADPSDTGRLMALAAEVARPEAAIKNKYFNMIQNDKGELKLSEKQYIMYSMFDRDHPELHKPFVDTILKTMEELNETADDRYLLSYFNAFVPSDCTYEAASELKSLLISYEGNMKFPVLKSLKKRIESSERCAKVVTRYKD